MHSAMSTAGATGNMVVGQPNHWVSNSIKIGKINIIGRFVC
jgi:hypothetical protein